MKILARIIALVLFGLSTSVTTAQVKYTNQTVDMREGPGAYFDMMMRLYMNNEVRVDSSEGYWDMIRLDSQRGWIPSYALSDQQANENNGGEDSVMNRRDLMFAQLGGADNVGKDDLSASPAQIAAAVKGFAEKYRQSKKITTTVDFSKYQIDPYTVNEYWVFRNQRLKSDVLRKRQSLLTPSAPFMKFAEPAIDQVGYAVASVLAQKGLVDNYEVQKYLDLMIALIVEVSHRPELRTHAYILDVDEVVGYSLPGNYIFISRGALEKMNNESELAHFLSHEVAHIIFGHGVQEIDKREIQIRAEDAFSELRNAFKDENEEYTRVEEELNTMADEIYEYINKDRLEAYETEADYWGLVYTYLIGLDPYQSRNFLQNIDEVREEASLEWSGITREKRLQYLNSNLGSGKLGRGTVNTADFIRMKRNLQ